jgi:hypothetical protein
MLVEQPKLDEEEGEEIKEWGKGTKPNPEAPG